MEMKFITCKKMGIGLVKFNINRLVYLYQVDDKIKIVFDGSCDDSYEYYIQHRFEGDTDRAYEDLLDWLQNDEDKTSR
jgi:hypothetical protein